MRRLVQQGPLGKFSSAQLFSGPGMREVTSGSCQTSMANGWMLASAVIAAFAACRIGCAAGLPKHRCKADSRRRTGSPGRLSIGSKHCARNSRWWRGGAGRGSAALAASIGRPCAVIGAECRHAAGLGRALKCAHWGALPAPAHAHQHLSDW